MSNSNARMAYLDCYDILDKAVEDNHGCRVRVPNIEAAFHLRMRLHQARKIDRKENNLKYEPGEKMYGQSIYDLVVIRIRSIDGFVFLYLEKPTAKPLHVETLSDLPEDQQKALPAPSLQKLLDAAREPEHEVVKLIPAPIKRRI